MERFFDIKKSDGIVVKKVDKIMLGTKQTQVEYFIRLKFEIIEIRNCIRYIVFRNFKEIGKAVKKSREATVDRVILYRSWKLIGGCIRSSDKNFLDNSQVLRLLRLSRYLLFYYNIFYTTTSFSRRELKSEGGGEHLKH